MLQLCWLCALMGTGAWFPTVIDWVKFGQSWKLVRRIVLVHVGPLGLVLLCHGGGWALHSSGEALFRRVRCSI